MTCCGETLIAGGQSHFLNRVSGNFQFSVCMVCVSSASSGAAGCICSLDLSNSPSTPHTLIPSLSPPPCLIAGVSSNYFAVLQPGGVVSLRDTKYGTNQASMETGLHSVATVSLCLSVCLPVCLSVCLSVCLGFGTGLRLFHRRLSALVGIW